MPSYTIKKPTFQRAVEDSRHASFVGKHFEFSDFTRELIFEGRISDQHICAEFRWAYRWKPDEGVNYRKLGRMYKWIRGNCQKRFINLCSKYGWTSCSAEQVLLNELNLFEAKVEARYKGTLKAARRAVRKEASRQRREERKRQERLERARLSREAHAVRRFPCPKDEIQVVPAFYVGFDYRPLTIARMVRVASNLGIERRRIFP